MTDPKDPINISDIESLYRQYHKTLCNVAYGIVKDKDTAGDIVQNVFIQVWKKREATTINSSIKGYLIRATMNASVYYLRTSKRRFQVEEEAIKERPLAFNNSEDRLRESELEDKIKEALFRLPLKCRTIFLLNRYEGMKYKEIALQLGLSLKTVENQMSIALEKLRKDLRPYLTPEFLKSLSLIVLALAS
jgi:RNA polymerase sigma-70 factor, ECF subfamily